MGHAVIKGASEATGASVAHERIALSATEGEIILTNHQNRVIKNIGKGEERSTCAMIMNISLNVLKALASIFLVLTGIAITVASPILGLIGIPAALLGGFFGADAIAGIFNEIVYNPREIPADTKTMLKQKMIADTSMEKATAMIPFLNGSMIQPEVLVHRNALDLDIRKSETKEVYTKFLKLVQFYRIYANEIHHAQRLERLHDEGQIPHLRFPSDTREVINQFGRLRDEFRDAYRGIIGAEPVEVE